MSSTVIHMRTVPGKPDQRRLDWPLIRSAGPDVPKDFIWDGSSVPRFFRRLFPKWRHPMASCGHDYDCRNAKNRQDRKIADQRFREVVARTSKFESVVGFVGVRIGAFFGVGNNF